MIAECGRMKPYVSTSGYLAMRNEHHKQRQGGQMINADGRRWTVDRGRWAIDGGRLPNAAG